MKDLGLPIGCKGIWVISGSCRAGNGYPDWVSTSASLSLSTDWLRLPTTATSPNDGPATGAISVSGRTTSGSGLVANPVISEWISARTVTLDRLSPGSRAECHPCKLGLGDHFRSGYFRFRWVQGGGAGADPEIGSLVRTTKPGFFHGKARILRYICYTELRWRLKIPSSLFMDQSINGNFATKTLQFYDFSTEMDKTNLAIRIRNQTNIFSSKFPGDVTLHFPERSTRWVCEYVWLAVTARCVRKSHTVRGSPVATFRHEEAVASSFLVV